MRKNSKPDGCYSPAKSKRFLCMIMTMIMLAAFAPSATRAETAVKYGDYLYYKVNESGTEITITDCETNATGIVIPDEIEGLPVTGIGNSAFSQCRSLTSITIPDSITSIGSYAFDCCFGLERVYITDLVAYLNIDGCSPMDYAKELYLNNNKISGEVVIPVGITKMVSSAFSNCDDITGVIIPDGVTSIGDSAFENCDSLTSVIIPYGVTSIGNSAFSCCGGLTSVTIGNDVTSIGHSAFSFCGNLTNVTIGNSVASIGKSAFDRCSKLTSITIPGSVKSIGDNAFYGSGLTDLIIEDGVENIEAWAFYACSKLKNITLPDSIKSIGHYAFIGTEYYNNKENRENGVLYIGNHLIEANLDESFTDYAIKDGTKTIASRAFADEGVNMTLTCVTIPDSVVSIGDYAFGGRYNMTKIIIGKGVTSIGEGAFEYCHKLTDIYYRGTQEDWEKISIIGEQDTIIENAVKHYEYIPAPTSSPSPSPNASPSASPSASPTASPSPSPSASPSASPSPSPSPSPSVKTGDRVEFKQTDNVVSAQLIFEETTPPAENDIVLIAAYMDNEELKRAEMPAVTDMKAEFVIPKEYRDYEIIMYVWNKNMKPLMKAQKADI